MREHSVDDMVEGNPPTFTWKGNWYLRWPDTADPYFYEQLGYYKGKAYYIFNIDEEEQLNAAD